MCILVDILGNPLEEEDVKVEKEQVVHILQPLSTASLWGQVEPWLADVQQIYEWLM